MSALVELVLPLPDLLLSPAVIVTVALLQTGDQRLAVSLDLSDVFVSQPLPAQLCVPLKLPPIGSDLPPPHHGLPDHLMKASRTQ